MQPSPQEIIAMDDARLLDLYRSSGEVLCLGYLYNRYTPLVYGLCLKYLGSVDDAQDAVLDLFEELVVKVRRHEIREFRTWLYSVARNHCLMRLRRRRIEIPLDSRAERVDFPLAEHLFDEQGDAQLRRALAECMERLPEPQRRSITLFYMEENSYADIAARCGWHAKSVKSYIQNGRRNLRVCIEKHGV